MNLKELKATKDSIKNLLSSLTNGQIERSGISRFEIDKFYDLLKTIEALESEY